MRRHSSVTFISVILLLGHVLLIGQTSSNESINVNDVKIIRNLDQNILFNLTDSSVCAFLNSNSPDSIVFYYNEIENEGARKFHYGILFLDIGSMTPEDTCKFISFDIQGPDLEICVRDVINIQVGMDMNDIKAQFGNAELNTDKVFIDFWTNEVYGTTIPLNYNGVLLDTYLLIFHDIETELVLRIAYGY